MRVIIIGGDKTVYFLARQLSERGDQVTIINRDKERCEELAQQINVPVIHGDGSDINRLEEAGARRADILLALTPNDQDNLIACQLAQKIFGLPRTLGLANDPENEEIFKQLGVGVAFSATRLISSLIEQQAHFEDIATLMPIAKGRINVTEVRLDPESPAIGKTLQELDLTGGALVAAVVRDDAVIIPRGSTRLQIEDHLILITQPETHQQDMVTLCGANL